MERTLLDDIEKIYFSLPCETEDNNYCYYCGWCKNLEFCKLLETIIYSLRKHYLQSTRNYYKKFL